MQTEFLWTLSKRRGLVFNNLYYWLDFHASRTPVISSIVGSFRNWKRENELFEYSLAATTPFHNT
jgi:hypothetical protein